MPLNITDPGNWKIINQNLIDMLVKISPSKVKVDNFPKDSENRHFSFTHYTRYLSNGEKTIRKWLVYSISLDKVFCFCCKLFKQEENTFQLYFRSTMSQERLNGLTILSIEKHMLEQINFNSLIIDFLSKNACRINLQ